MENTKKGFDFNSMDTGSKIAMGLSVLGVVGCFLPYLTASMMGMSESANILKAGNLGYLVLAAFAFSALTPVIGDQLNSINGALGRFAPRGSVIIALVALALQAVVDMTSESTKAAKAFGVSISFGIGFYIMIAAGIVIILIQQKIIKIK
jgi:hypothetical protein